ncbi:hypothetical protein ULMS_02770 [Patiriisocius marinistellae]|uniref:Uncharacterized protein n=1 Tax=Patiriisocius marinistellae TaxID=2494560 RepID=A0A5J4FXF5_9FLAO|nr:hypothetical protein [Patiriisocius marinistellae]GEQ84769.1 hypothetical protein ULMS_02770 [Patiriisocius marinistellae]
MKDTNTNSKKTSTTKKVLTIAGIALAFFIGIPFGYGMYHGIKAHTGNTGAIEKILTKNCNCDVDFEFSSYGIHVSKKDGINGQTAQYNLMNYNKEVSVVDEASRLNNILKNEVESYNEIDVLTLHFISETKTETVKFKNGSILY